jgi:hypothetical protein
MPEKVVMLLQHIVLAKITGMERREEEVPAVALFMVTISLLYPGLAIQFV